MGRGTEAAWHAQATGHPRLVRAAKATVQRILDEPQPNSVGFYKRNDEMADDGSRLDRHR